MGCECSIEFDSEAGPGVQRKLSFKDIGKLESVQNVQGQDEHSKVTYQFEVLEDLIISPRNDETINYSLKMKETHIEQVFDVNVQVSTERENVEIEVQVDVVEQDVKKHLTELVNPDSIHDKKEQDEVKAPVEGNVIVEDQTTVRNMAPVDDDKTPVENKAPVEVEATVEDQGNTELKTLPISNESAMELIENQVKPENTTLNIQSIAGESKNQIQLDSKLPTQTSKSVVDLKSLIQKSIKQELKKKISIGTNKITLNIGDDDGDDIVGEESSEDDDAEYTNQSSAIRRQEQSEDTKD